MARWAPTSRFRRGSRPRPTIVVPVGDHDASSRETVAASTRQQTLPGCSVGSLDDVTDDTVMTVFVDPGWDFHSSFAAAAHHQVAVENATAVYADDAASPRPHPDWAPESLLGRCVIGGVLAVTPECWQQLGDVSVPVSVHDIALRLVEAGASAHHIRSPLTSGPAAGHEVTDHIRGTIERRVDRYLADYGVRSISGHQKHPHFTSAPELVSVIVPTAGRADDDGRRFIDRFLTSLSTNRTQHDLDVIAVTHPDMDEVRTSGLAVSSVSYRVPFNFSDACNSGAAHARGAVLAFVNDDIEITDPLWLDDLVALTHLPGVGAVGPVLMYPDGTVQSAGHVDPGPTTFARGYRLTSGDDPWVEEQLSSIRNATGITAACMVIRQSIFNAAKGFDSSFPLAFNDVDLCNRIVDAGYRVVVSPTCSVIHHESRTRPGGASPGEEQFLVDRWPNRHQIGQPDAFLG